MLEGMERKRASESGPLKEPWFLYILECSDGTLYTGITKEIERRIAQHNAGTASRYTRVRRPVKLLYTEICVTRTAALIRECQVKEMARIEKLSLINTSPSSIVS